MCFPKYCDSLLDFQVRETLCEGPDSQLGAVEAALGTGEGLSGLNSTRLQAVGVALADLAFDQQTLDEC